MAAATSYTPFSAAREGRPLRVVTNEIKLPTYTNDLAEAVAQWSAGALRDYHLVNEGQTSRYGLARQVLDLAGYRDMPIAPIALAEYPRPSRPPEYAPLRIAAARPGIRLRPWTEALADFIRAEAAARGMMSDSIPLVSVVIPNWNGAHHLPTCLDALRAQTYPRVEVIVADNASTDGSLNCWPSGIEVRVVALAENRGFTGACNAGMRAAAEIIVLLNNDTEAEPSWLSEVVAALERHPTREWSPRRCCCLTTGRAFTPPEICTGSTGD